MFLVCWLKIPLYIGYPYTWIIIAAAEPWYSRHFNEARFVGRSNSLDFSMHTIQYELNQESVTDF